MKVYFETGRIAPREAHFDHHSAVAASDAFCVAKMAAVQFLEWAVMTGTDPRGVELEVNHVGHLDDMVAFGAAPAAEVGKLRALYAFACQVSVLDSCGPSGYALVQRPVKALVDAVYSSYHEALDRMAVEAGVSKFALPLEKRIEASKEAGRLLVSLLPEDDYEPATPWVPAEGTYRVLSTEDSVVLVEGLADSFNPLRASAFFYAQGVKAVVGFRPTRGVEGRRDFDICVRSNFDADLSGLWPKLAEAEPDVPERARNWGGHAGAGGSPRADARLGYLGGSVRTPEEIHALVRECVG